MLGIHAARLRSYFRNALPSYLVCRGVPLKDMAYLERPRAGSKRCC
jgi:hypothetical protein